MAERMHYDLQRTGNLERREAMVTDLVQNVVKTTSNLIEDSAFIRQSWSDLRPDELGRAITALLIGLEENAFLLAETVQSEKIIIKPTDNVCKYLKSICLAFFLLFKSIHACMKCKKADTKTVILL